MRHARQHAARNTRERRHRLAQEAARLMAEGGIRDYHQAKRKAAERLGIHDDASLPRNSEVEDALREYQRLFLGEGQQAHTLRMRREAALQALGFFEPFQPRLVGRVLDGTADEHTPVSLHLHADDADEVTRFLADAGVPAEASSRRMRLDRTRDFDAPVWTFSADGLAFDLTVLPLDTLRQAPLSGIDERPMQRASSAQLRLLLSEDECADGSNAPR
ncbi:hypothetical protein WCE41_11990 [Luteimonas sp. MJ246]|uniref:hypothetical protein n=1 Tax=Luteimonas sp. MJ174 TaxID=3129237 RepID=UPI0031BB4BC7